MKFTNISPNPPMIQCVRKEETYILVVKVYKHKPKPPKKGDLN